jgi:hypothetical protein
MKKDPGSFPDPSDQASGLDLPGPEGAITTLSGSEAEKLLLSLVSSRLDSVVERNPADRRADIKQELLLEMLDRVSAHDQVAATTDFPTLVASSRELLGSRLLAYVAGIADTSELDEWQSGDSRPTAETQQRIRIARRAASMIADMDGRAVAQAWFQGVNPLLNEDAPARVLREQRPDQIKDGLFEAVSAFLAG